MRTFFALGFLLFASGCSSVDGPDEEAILDDLYQRSRQYYDIGDLARAEQQARKGLEIDPDHTMLNLVLGRTLLQRKELKAIVQARPYLEKAHDQDPDYRTAYSLGEYHLRYSEFLIGQADILDARREEFAGDDSKAMEDMVQRSNHQREKSAEHLGMSREFLETTLKETPDNIYALRLVANCYAHQNADEAALETIMKLVSLLQESRRFKNERLALREFSVAEESYIRQALREDINMEIQAHGLAAAIRTKNKEFEQAKVHFTDILRLNPDLSHEYFNRGMCHYWTGDLSSAARDMKSFVSKTNREIDSEEVAQALDIISQFQGQPVPTGNSSNSSAGFGEDG